MKEKIRKKTKRPQTEDMIFTEEDFEDVSEDERKFPKTQETVS